MMRAPYGADACDQGRHSLSLLRLAAMPAWRGQDGKGWIGSRVPATEIEDAVVKSLNEYLRSQGGCRHQPMAGQSAIAGLVDRIDVILNRLAVRLKSGESPGTINDPSGRLSVRAGRRPSNRFRQILLPHGVSRKEIRPERPERRLRLVNAIARGRRWLDEMISGSVTDAQQIALRERCSVRHVNDVSLAFLPHG